MSFPKKREDVERVVEEVEESHHHDHHHHHHHEEDANARMLIDALSARLASAEERVDMLSAELAKVYKVLAHMVEILQSDDPEIRRRALAEAIKALEK